MCETTRQSLARISSTKNIFVTESEASQPEDKRTYTHRLPRWTGVGSDGSRGAGTGTMGRAAPSGREWSAKRNPRCRHAQQRRPPPAPAGRVLLRPAAYGYQNHNKNKHKLKDNCQAGEDDDNHLSTFCVPTIYAVTLATVRSVKRGPNVRRHEDSLRSRRQESMRDL